MPRIRLLCIMILASCSSLAQADSALLQIAALPVKFINQVDEKATIYSKRITGKTEKTLAKLARWENKIEGLLQRLDPAAAMRLFGNEQTTFRSLLKQIQEGKTVFENYKAQYDEYRDRLTTGIKYLQQQKENLKNNIVKPLNGANKKLTALESDLRSTEAIVQFIKERKKKLVDEAVKYIGNSRYLTKISKQSYYYIETLHNYKEIFSDPKKAEETALKLLNEIPAFQDFVLQNSMLSGLFKAPAGEGDISALAGLQTRSGINALIQDRLLAGGPNAQDIFKQNMQEAQAELTQMKDRILKGGGNSSDAEISNFKPNTQKTKTFLQRLEYGTNLQFVKSNSLLPAAADIGFSIGYKLNDKSIVGLGAGYKLGIGSINRIRLSTQGISFRGYVDWKLKKQFFISGGYEMNYLTQLPATEQVANRQTHPDAWQSSGLIGITKKLNIQTKFFKATKLQLLYDMLYRQHIPVTQPVLFRVGYSFK